MLDHQYQKPQSPSRVVILGAGGFVGQAARRALQAAGTSVLPIGRKDIDLLDAGAGAALASRLAPSDTLIVISAEAPCKNPAMLVRNVQMMGAVCEALETVHPAHLVYVSSDAVYKDSMEPLTETSATEPGSIHGIMHLAREMMLRDCARCPLAIVRPTLIYGAGDPHNGYGPNRFARLAEQGQPIVLFGEGEERRDHIHIDDIAELLRLIIFYRSAGVLNAATGEVISFRDIALMIAGLYDRSVPVEGSPRIGPMPHNGYRAFSPEATFTAFQEFRYLPPAEGFAFVHAGRVAKV